MNTIYSDFLLDQAKRIRGELEFNDYTAFSTCPEEQQPSLDRNTRHHYLHVKQVLDAMQTYGENHWWIYSGPSLIEKKVRIYYQIFDLGVEFLLMDPGKLCNDINDVLSGISDIPLTTWMLRFHRTFFDRYQKKLLADMLRDDQDLKEYITQKVDSS